jgi:flagellar biosynthesis GTPase FlhF
MITLIANNLQDAMADVKDRLGDGATIVSWKHLGDKIEVTATSPENSVKTNPVEGGRDGFAQKGVSPRYDIFAHEEELARKEKAKLQNNLLAQAQKLKAAQPKNAKSPIAPKSKGIEPLVKANTAAPTPKTPLNDLVPILVKAGLSLKEIKPFAKYFGQKPPKETLIEILAGEFEYAPIDAAPETAIALVGPAGCGKTISAAKLAARALSADIEVLLISTDTERQGGVEQLKILAKKLGAGFNFAESASIARNLTQSALDAGKVVIIDSAASTPYEPASMRVLEGLLEQTGAEPIFCAPCDFRHDDLGDFADAFVEIGIKRAILTRFDLTQRRAGFINAFHNRKISFAQASISPFIAGGLVPASPKRLAGFIIDDI